MKVESEGPAGIPIISSQIFKFYKGKDVDDMDEEELMRRAQELSLQEAPGQAEKSKGNI